jgi:hypothetical protein
MKIFLTIFFSALSFIASSQVFIKSSQISSNCISGIAAGSAAEDYGGNINFSGCLYWTLDDESQNVYEIYEYKNGEVISRITFNPETGLVQSTETPNQTCQYFDDGRLAYRCVYGSNHIRISEIKFRIVKNKYIIEFNKTFDNQGKVIECVGKGCE